MDSIYQFASQVLCLLDMHIDYYVESPISDFIEAMLPIRDLSAVANSPYLEDYLRVLERFASDRWFTRA